MVEESLVAPGVMQDVVRQERLQRDLLVVQLEDLLVLALVEVELGEQWQEVVVESLAVVEHDNPLVLQQEELLGEELTIIIGLRAHNNNNHNTEARA